MYFEIDTDNWVNTDQIVDVVRAGDTITYLFSPPPMGDVSVTYDDEAEAIDVLADYIEFANTPQYNRDFFIRTTMSLTVSTATGRPHNVQRVRGGAPTTLNEQIAARAYDLAVNAADKWEAENP